jgi:hypothetical protein
MLTAEAVVFGPRTEPDMGLVEDLIRVERMLKAQSRWVAGPSTLFDVLGLVRREIPSCKVIRWIMDPLAPHGLGKTVLAALLEWLNEGSGDVTPQSRDRLRRK